MGNELKMTRYFFLFFGCMWSAGLFSQEFRYRVDFTDKANSPFSVSYPSQYLSQRAIDRRTAQGIPVLENDLPVNQVYIDSILNSGNVKLLNRSKWLNSITISTDDSTLIDSINTYSFVLNAVQWRKTKSGFSEEKLRAFHRAGRMADVPPSTRTGFTEGTKAGLDYGAAFNQVNMINADFLHDQGFKGEGMLIAVLDAGFIYTDSMQAFDHLFQSNRIIATWNFVDGNDSVFKAASHGTFVLSTMAANLPSLIIGTAPEAAYMLLISEDIASETIIEEFNWVSAAEFADSAGADIINSSLGYTTFDPIPEDTLFLANPFNHTYAEMNGDIALATVGADIAASKGILVVNSAGNSGANDWNFIGVPADGDSVFSIGAVDADRNYASFSSNGPTADGRVKPDVCAQGQASVIASFNDSIIWGSGTSFSSPIMAGAIACFWQSAAGKTNIEIMNLVRQSASQYNTPDTLLGFGIPDFEVAYEILTNRIFVDSDSFVIYPNPFSEKLNIDYYSADRKLISVEMVDLAGRRIFYSERNLEEGLNRIPLGRNVSAGNSPYILLIKSGETTLKRVVVKI